MLLLFCCSTRIFMINLITILLPTHVRFWLAESVMMRGSKRYCGILDTQPHLELKLSVFSFLRLMQNVPPPRVKSKILVQNLIRATNQTLRETWLRVRETWLRQTMIMMTPVHPSRCLLYLVIAIFFASFICCIPYTTNMLLCHLLRSRSIYVSASCLNILLFISLSSHIELFIHPSIVYVYEESTKLCKNGSSPRNGNKKVEPIAKL